MKDLNSKVGKSQPYKSRSREIPRVKRFNCDFIINELISHKLISHNRFGLIVPDTAEAKDRERS